MAQGNLNSVHGLFYFPLLFLTGLLAGTVDAIAGGGGLITVPVLLGVGMPPQIALGTNKLQASFGSGSAMLHFIRSGTVNLRDCIPGIMFTSLGAAAGVLSVQWLDPLLLRRTIPLLLAGIALYTYFSPWLGSEDVHARWKPLPFYLLFGLSIGFYDGFLGPGTGSFWVVALVTLLGLSLVRATAHTKVMNFTSNFVALVVFLLAGQVCFMEGLTMGAGQFIGARIGAGLVTRRGAGFVRPVFICMVFAVLGKLIWQNFR